MTVAINPYAILGVRRNASVATIRRAYRTLSKAAHPDAGGAPEAFARLRLAHDVLIDPERRARYDTTGVIAETAADNCHVAITGVIGQALDEVLAEIDKQRKPPREYDLARFVRLKLESYRSNLEKTQATLKAARPIWQDIMARFEAQPGTANLLERIAAARIQAIDDKLPLLATAVTEIAAALTVLEGQSFRVETPPPVAQQAMGYYAATSTRATGRW